MPRFAYTARSADGRTAAAALDAPSRREAARLLAARGLQVVRLEEEAAHPSAERPGHPGAGRGRPAATARPPVPASARRFGPELQLPFLQSLADLIGSGLPAGEAVRLLAQRLQEPALRGLCGALWEKLSEGQPLSQALEAFPHVFSGHTANLVAAGEATGNLREVLGRLIDHHTAREEMRRTIAAAFAYPAFIGLIAVGVVLFFIFFLLPRLQNLLNSLGGSMPPATRLLVGLSDFLLHYGLFLVVGGALAAVAFWRWRRTEAGRARTDALLLRLPWAGRFITASTVYNFSATLAVLLENGVATAEALRMTERTIASRPLRAAFGEATGRVLEGESLSQALARTGCFPPLVIDRLAVGESTGQLAPGLRSIASSYQDDLRRRIKAFTQVVSTGVLLFAFGFVAFIAYAIVSAVFQVSASFKF